MKNSTLCFRAAVAFILVGMAIGIGMGISGDHSLAPAHAHINLVGWVSTFLIGIYYRFDGDLDSSKSARNQIWIWILGTVIMTTGVTIIYVGYGEPGEPIGAIGSLIVFAAMLYFALLVYRSKA